jgi:uncharacterized membrane protein YeaQ/YmgE (transglycosylase-associated protein family)
MIAIICWLVFGWIAGTVAEWLWPPAAPRSKLVTIGIGVAGSVAGGLVGSVITGSNYAPGGLILSVAGALLCMFVYKKYNEANP